MNLLRPFVEGGTVTRLTRLVAVAALVLAVWATPAEAHPPDRVINACVTYSPTTT